jgi:hypothetical protein
MGKQTAEEPKQKTLRHDQIAEKYRKEIPVPKREDFFRNLKKVSGGSVVRDPKK